MIGIFASAILLVVLGFSRQWAMDPVDVDYDVRDVETLMYEPPPPPPMVDESLADAPPPPPSLTQLSEIPDATRVSIPMAKVPMDITTPVENFFSDTPPDPLPEVKATPPLERPRPVVPAPVKTHYQESELDGTPRLLRHGTAVFPASLARQGVSRGTVAFEVELSKTGVVTVRKVISSTHPELVAAARKVAASARFTPPMRNGRPVMAIMQWAITIEK